MYLSQHLSSLSTTLSLSQQLSLSLSTSLSLSKHLSLRRPRFHASSGELALGVFLLGLLFLFYLIPGPAPSAPSSNPEAERWSVRGRAVSEELHMVWAPPRATHSKDACPRLPPAACTELAKNFSLVVPSFIASADATATWLRHTLERLGHSLVTQERYCPAEVIFVVAGVDTNEQANTVRDCLTRTLTASRLPSALTVLTRPGVHYAGANRNLGVNHATRRFVMLSDDDDSWHPRRTLYLVNAVTSDTILLTHNFYITRRNLQWTPLTWDINAPPAYITRANTEVALRPACAEPRCAFVHHGYPTVRRDAWHWTPAREDLARGQDVDFLLRLYHYCETHLPSGTEFYRHINASLLVYYYDWKHPAFYVEEPLA
ncbi:uncharacterized protein MONBRDRAFT_25356 [Monosiga brevicollis MX1]|uniref:Glycosyltransferase 2-like domain-containing protein n=1 Tax=Monosiga brevicollis TaxID=81824 RepID=A9UZ61_MONBE|nr:uncharacterized protein MONBRDRAFT_25356 [Monosiga brevicollis MX1]EDQ89178.1 predicted protein [Monosiga brevicollis MX1]|eukprot:XP_001745754.1 hypothetical protein [Monosiga brevicollis MX1]